MKKLEKRCKATDGGLVFPTDEDLNGAATALVRLQDTYNLDIQEISEGKILGKKYSTSFTGMWIT